MSAQRERSDVELVDAIRRGLRVTDAQFDGLFPPEVRALSDIHWTPVAVVRAALQLLGLVEGDRVLDVGSGPGKVCLLGAVASPAEFIGVEHREDLVEAARRAAGRLSARRADFICADAFEVDWSGFQVVYLFNPFAGLAALGSETLAEADRARFTRSLELATRALSCMPRGARVVLYHGLGAPLPEGYVRRAHVFAGTGTLEVYQQTA